MFKISRFTWLGLSLVLAGVVVIPMLLKAENVASSLSTTSDTVATVNNAQEEVTLSDSDTPLIRKVKLSRNWHLYNDGTTVWALYKGSNPCGNATSSSCGVSVLTKRAVQTMNFFTAFKANFRILRVAPERLTKFTTGEPITSVDGLTPEMFVKRPYLTYRLVKAVGKAAVYLFDGQKLKPIIHEKVFNNFGWNFSDVETLSATELSAYPVVESVTAETVFNDDVVAETSQLRENWDEVKARLQSANRLQKVKDAVIKAVNSNDYYLLTANGKRKINSNQVASKLKIDLSKAVEVMPEELVAIPTQAVVTEATPVAEVNVSAK